MTPSYKSIEAIDFRLVLFPFRKMAQSKIRIYTKKGDDGTTSLFNSERRTKDSDYFHALGDVDELNAQLGVAQAICIISPLTDQLTEIQSRLFDLGAHLATPRSNSSTSKQSRTEFLPRHVEALEQWIDSMEESLAPLRTFILPGGGMLAAQFHVARAVCRRAERSVTPLIARGDTEHVIGAYLNRLSDYLFVAARYTTVGPETAWKKVSE